MGITIAGIGGVVKGGQLALSYFEFKPPTDGLLSQYKNLKANPDIVTSFEDIYPLLLRKVKIAARRGKVDLAKRPMVPSTEPYLRPLLAAIDKLIAMQNFIIVAPYGKIHMKFVAQASRQRETCLKMLRQLFKHYCELHFTILPGMGPVPSFPESARDAYILIRNQIDGVPKNVSLWISTRAESQTQAFIPSIKPGTYRDPYKQPPADVSSHTIITERNV